MLLSTNRIFCKVEAKQGEVDVFIGNLSPLNVAQVIELYRGDYLFIYLSLFYPEENGRVESNKRRLHSLSSHSKKK